MSAVILVPSQGSHANQFLESARSVLAKVYGGSGKVFKTVIADSLLADTILGGGVAAGFVNVRFTLSIAVTARSRCPAPERIAQL